MIIDLAYAMGPNPQGGQAAGSGLTDVLLPLLVIFVFYLVLRR